MELLQRRDVGVTTAPTLPSPGGEGISRALSTREGEGIRGFAIMA
jgi:hypothetical protein